MILVFLHNCVQTNLNQVYTQNLNISLYVIFITVYSENIRNHVLYLYIIEYDE